MAAGKRDPYKFNIRFSADNPSEVLAAKYLNSIGTKAPYIAALVAKDLAESGMLQMYNDMPAPEPKRISGKPRERPAETRRSAVKPDDEGVMQEAPERAEMVAEGAWTANRTGTGYDTQYDDNVVRAANIISQSLPSMFEDEEDDDDE